MGAQLPARWPGGSERLSSMPDGTMNRLEGAVAGQLQCRVRRLVVLEEQSPFKTGAKNMLVPQAFLAGERKLEYQSYPRFLDGFPPNDLRVV